MALGRGLASLIPRKEKDLSASKKDGSSSSQNNKESVFYVEVERIKPNPYQPRREFSEESLKGLADSIREYGVIQPLIVSKIEMETDNGVNVEYQLIAGERRLRAAEMIGLSQVPVVIRKATNEEKLAIALIENVQRDDLNPMEKAMAFSDLIDKFHLPHREIARRISKSREFVTNALRLLSLPAEIQRAVFDGVISEGHARAILTIDTIERQKILFEQIVKKGLSVRQAEEMSRGLRTVIKNKNKPVSDPETRELEGKLQDALGTRVKFCRKGETGKIVIEFFSEEELSRFLSKIGIN